MGIFSHNKDKEKGKLVLVFDIGSSSVGGALFWKEKSGIPKIVLAFREPIALDKNIDVNQFLSLTIKSLEIVVNKIYMTGMGAPKMIFCVLSSPWHVSQTRIIKLKKNMPFVFTSKLADALLQKELFLFEAEEENFVEYMHAGNSVRSIELKNIQMRLNGYETLKPLDQKIEELEMTVFISISPDQVLKKIEETIMQHFHSSDIKFSSFVMTSFAVVRDLYINQENFLLIDVGGEVTDIFMIKKNILHESISFPFGLNFIIREVASAFNCSISEAKSYIALFQNGHAEKSLTKKIEAVLNKLKSYWLTKFQESLANLSNDISIPATIYITVDKDLADFFCQTIETEQFNQYTLTESKFKVILLDAKVFHGMAVFDGNIIRDPGLIIDSIYINRFFN